VGRAVDRVENAIVNDVSLGDFVLTAKRFVYGLLELRDHPGWIRKASTARATVTGNTEGGILNGGTLTVSNSTVSGNSAGYGGGISNGGTLTLDNSTIGDNSAHGGGGDYFGYGGGILNNGTLTAINSTVTGNSAHDGGGIYNLYGIFITLTNCTISGNDGGGIYQYSGTLTLDNSTVSGNSNYGFHGGGIFNEDGAITLTNSTVSGNSTDGHGGGIINVYGTLTLEKCTVNANSAYDGGGIYNNDGTFTVDNSTVSGNLAVNGGGGIVSGGTVTLTNSTVSGHSTVDGSGAGIYIAGILQAWNSIISGNAAPTAPDVSGHLRSFGNNLISNTQGGSGFDPTDLLNVDPMLGPLQDNGGPTQTMALMPSSPALNVGDPNQLGTADQRGVVRSGGVNIGAYQASATALLVSAPDTVQSGVPFDVTVTAVDPYSQVAVGYTGTVTFSTNDPDPGVVLPADYPFMLGDGGSHTFTDTGLGETTLITPGPQTLTVMDTADNTITGSAIVTVNAGPGPTPHGQGPPPPTLQATPAQAESPPVREPYHQEMIAIDRWFVLFHDKDDACLSVPPPMDQAPDATDAWQANPFDKEEGPLGSVW
jgi:hypothetical protein